MNNGTRVMEQALTIGNGQGLKPPDKVSASESHTSDDRANPVTYVDEEKPVINVVTIER